ncbi:MAG: hypothetical protein AAFN11_07360, partial [Chloroflexota bacterium]
IRVNFFMMLLMVSALLVGTTAAQTTTTVDNSPDSSVFYLFAACETEAVVDFNGTMESGFDLYIQVFDQIGAAGGTLVPLTRVSVSGEYQVSQRLTYADGRTLLLGQFASAEISIASENDPTNVIYSEIVDDVRDGCIEPAFGTTDTFGVDGVSEGSTTPLIDPITGNVIESSDDIVINSSGIYTPDGGTLNDEVVRPEALVQIGARPSEVAAVLNAEDRKSDPGLIFAECNQFPLADPGTVWDTDTIVIFWSWFASTPELVQDHIDNANYEVFLSSEYVFRQPFPNVVVSPITEREDGNFWVFYTANLGDGFRPGEYNVSFYVDWDVAISDGFENFGPDTANEFFLSGCTFDIEINPFDIVTDLNNPTIPLQQD